MDLQSADLNGRARIRNAALEEFSEKGDAASIRSIAQRAACSPALVQHHFGTKAGLRQACDAYVLGFYRTQVAEGVDQHGIADPDYVTRLYRDAPIVLRYLIRGLMENTPAAAKTFDELVDLSVGYLHGSPDVPPHDRAAVLVAMKLGTLVLAGHLERNLHAEPFSPGYIRRTGAAMLDILNPRLAAADIMDAARDASRPGKEEAHS
jgi:AcrR family transcriptional regulator